jgi:hypothetical protein
MTMNRHADGGKPGNSFGLPRGASLKKAQTQKCEVGPPPTFESLDTSELKGTPKQYQWDTWKLTGWDHSNVRSIKNQTLHHLAHGCEPDMTAGKHFSPNDRPHHEAQVSPKFSFLYAA